MPVKEVNSEKERERERERHREREKEEEGERNKKSSALSTPESQATPICVAGLCLTRRGTTGRNFAENSEELPM